MRWLLVRMARALPSRSVADRVLPWIMLLLAAFGAGWTLFQYTNGVDIQRANTTLSIHRQFLDTFPDGAQSFTQVSDDERVREILKIRCERYEKAVADGILPDQPPLPDCATVSEDDFELLGQISPHVPQSIRDDIRTEMNLIKVGSFGDARRMMTFFRSLQVCVERNQCNIEITSELFAGDIVAFLNASCSVALVDREFDRQGRILAGFARGLLPDGVIPWNTDPSRIDLFSCDYLRKST